MISTTHHTTNNAAAPDLVSPGRQAAMACIGPNFLSIEQYPRFLRVRSTPRMSAADSADSHS